MQWIFSFRCFRVINELYAHAAHYQNTLGWWMHWFIVLYRNLKFLISSQCFSRINLKHQEFGSCTEIISIFIIFNVFGRFLNLFWNFVLDYHKKICTHGEQKINCTKTILSLSHYLASNSHLTHGVSNVIATKSILLRKMCNFKRKINNITRDRIYTPQILCVYGKNFCFSCN